MNETIVISIGVLWIALLIDFILEFWYKSIWSQNIVTKIWQKGIEGDETSRGLFKYMCQLVFVGSTHRFNASNVLTTIELIHTNDKKNKTKLVTITVDYKDIESQRCLCFQTGFTSLYLVHRLKVLPPITRIRAIHHLPRGLHLIAFIS